MPTFWAKNTDVNFVPFDLQASVVIAVSSAHRAEALEAARFAIDTLKATVNICSMRSKVPALLNSLFRLAPSRGLGSHLEEGVL